MNLVPYVVLWSILGLTVLGLAGYRKVLMLRKEDELIHLGAGEEKRIPEQVALTQKLDAIDRWGKTLTVLTVASGLLIAAIYLYGAWQHSFQLK